MEGLPNWQMYGVPAAIWMVAVINYLRENWGVQVKWVFPISLGMAIGFGALLFLSELYSWALVVTQILVGGLLLALAVSGYYSGTKYRVESQNKLRED